MLIASGNKDYPRSYGREKGNIDLRRRRGNEEN